MEVKTSLQSKQSVNAGETVGIVGESGCGKSTLGKSIIRLLEPDEGTVLFQDKDVLSLEKRALREMRCEIQMIFQDPYGSLDSRMTIGEIVEEPLVIHGIGDRATRYKMMLRMLEITGLDQDAANRYPHEFSGGQRQRIGIARALALRPKLIIADEPVSALDVSIQSQILNLLVDLKEKFDLSYIFISHDLAVIEHVSDHVAVMYLGGIVETAPTKDLFTRPCHPYTEALIKAIPQPDPLRTRERIVLQGEIPDPENPPSGCAFHPRCPKVMDICKTETPEEKNIGVNETGHSIRCHLY
jgi:oligopeptide transport system ATP-binding protein